MFKLGSLYAITGGCGEMSNKESVDAYFDSLPKPKSIKLLHPKDVLKVVIECVEFLDAVPEAKARFEEMREVSPDW